MIQTTITTTGQGIDEMAEVFANILGGEQSGLDAGEMEAARKTVGKALDLVLSLAQHAGLNLEDLATANEMGTAGWLLTDRLAHA